MKKFYLNKKINKVIKYMKTYQSHSHKISGAIHFLVAQIKKIRHRETQILAKVTQDLGCLLIGLFA